ncbi:MAG TPA: LptF/LptG family permease [Pirellulales bacterium]
MSTLTRYILGQLAVVTLTALGLLTALVFCGFVYQEAKDQGLSPPQILRIMPYLLPETMRFSLPAAVLFAACLVYGRLAATNEITAVKSLGVHPLRVVAPSLILSLGLSAVAFWLNDLAVSWGRIGIERVIVEEIDEIVLGMLRVKKAFSTGSATLVVKKIEGTKLISPLLTFSTGPDAPPVKVAAEEAGLTLDAEHSSLTIVFRKGTIEVGSEATVQIMDVFEHTIPLAEIRRQNPEGITPAWLPMLEIPHAIAQAEENLRDNRLKAAGKAAQAMLLGRIELLTDPRSEINIQRRSHRNHEAHLARLHTEPWRRWAVSFSCFFFVLVGAPAAMSLRNSDVLVTFMTCWLPILFVYYPLLMMGIDWSKTGDVHPSIVWIANGVFLVAGAVLLRKFIRY